MTVGDVRSAIKDFPDSTKITSLTLLEPNKTTRLKIKLEDILVRGNGDIGFSFISDSVFFEE